VDDASDRGFGEAAGHQQVRVVHGSRLVIGGRGQFVLGQQVPDHVVVGAEASQQHVAGGQLHDLRGRQRGDQVGRFL